MKHIDNKLEIGSHKEGDEEPTDILNQKYFQDELDNMLTWSVRSQLKLQNFQPTDITDKQKQTNFSNIEFMLQTSRSILSTIYNQLNCPELLKAVMQSYEQSSFKKTTFTLDHSTAPKKEMRNLDLLVRDFDCFDNFIFDFVPVMQNYFGKNSVQASLNSSLRP